MKFQDLCVLIENVLFWNTKWSKSLAPSLRAADGSEFHLSSCRGADKFAHRRSACGEIIKADELYETNIEEMK